MIKVDFWTSMTTAQVISDLEKKNEAWRPFESAFHRWTPVSDSLVIPRTIHQIWLGSPLPKLYAQWGKTWRIKNPGWDYRLWTEKEIAEFGLVNQRSFDLSPNYGVKSDIARYEILGRFGGVYADTDFECLAPFDGLLSTEFFTGLMYGNLPAVNNGLIGSIPNHPILQAMIDDLGEPFFGQDGMDVLAYSGPTKFGEVCYRYLRNNPHSRTAVFPTSYFYPFPNRDIELKDLKKVKTWARPESLAVHYWEVSWRNQSMASRFYWWMKKRLPRPLFVGIYWLVKGRSPE